MHPPLILSSASLTGFQQTPPPPPPPPHPRLRSPSLCGTPRALSGLRYDITTASTTIIQQCGRIVAASGATPPSARRCRLSVSSAAVLPPRSHRLPPSAFPPSSPANKRASPRLPCCVAPASPLRSNPQLNTVGEMLYCYTSAPSALKRTSSHTRTYFCLPQCWRLLCFSSPPAYVRLSRSALSCSRFTNITQKEKETVFPPGVGGEVPGLY